MSTSSISASSPASVTSSLTASSTPASEANAAQDRFLKLLVAQLNNQDPMNPMDNAQMTSQMAQINTVTGINQLNETMKNMASQFLSMQILQGASMVGHDVLLSGNTLLNSGGRAQGAFELGDYADRITVDILSPGGQVLDSLDLGAKAAGRQTFEWDASRYQGEGSLRFKVSATRSGQDVPATPYSRDTIVSVGNDNGQMNVQLKGRSNVSYADIKAIF